MPDPKIPEFANNPKTVASILFDKLNNIISADQQWYPRVYSDKHIARLREAGMTNSKILFELANPSKLAHSVDRETDSNLGYVSYTDIIGNRTYAIANLIAGKDPLLSEITDNNLRRALGFAIANDIAAIRIKETDALLSGNFKEVKQCRRETQELERGFDILFGTVGESDRTLVKV